MRIEDAIQQKKPFRNNYHRSAVSLLYTNNWMRDKIRAWLKPYGVTVQQYNVLRILKGAGEPITTSTIRARLLDKMADTSRLVDRMFAKGWVNRQVCPHDKRLVDVYLTKEGLRLMEDLNEIADNLDVISKNLSDEEAYQLSVLLDKLRGKE